MGELLKQTLELYSESWKKDHDEVMKNYNAADCIGEVMSFGIFLFEGMARRLNNDETATVQSIEPALKTFSHWHTATAHVLAQAERLQSESYLEQAQKDQLVKLREYHTQAGGIVEELLDAKRAADSVKSKTSISLDTFLGELRNPVHR